MIPLTPLSEALSAALTKPEVVFHGDPVQKVRASWALSTETKAELRLALEWTGVDAASVGSWRSTVTGRRPRASEG